jgi:hypothetical protein
MPRAKTEQKKVHFVTRTKLSMVLLLQVAIVIVVTYGMVELWADVPTYTLFFAAHLIAFSLTSGEKRDPLLLPSALLFPLPLGSLCPHPFPFLEIPHAHKLIRNKPEQ